MLAVKTWEQTGVYDPTDPTQRIRAVYTPGGYSSFYWNRVPNDPAQPLSGLSDWASLPAWTQVAIVGAISAAAGYFGMSRYGDKYVKPALRKVGINLSGPRLRRRR